MKNQFHFVLLISLTLLAVSCTENTKTGSEQKADSLQTATDTKDTTQTNTEQENTEGFKVHDLFTSESNDVINTIAEEDYDGTLSKIAKYREGQLTATQQAAFKYIELYATSGLISKGKKKKSDLKTLLEKYSGHWLITQNLVITPGGGMPFNQIELNQEEPMTISVSLANNDGFNILFFVHVHMKETFDLSPHLGKRGYLIGNLSEFKLSDGDINSWIAELHLSDGEVRILEDEF